MNPTAQTLPGATSAHTLPVRGDRPRCEDLLSPLCGRVSCEAFDDAPLDAEVHTMDIGWLRCGHVRWNGRRLRRAGAPAATDTGKVLAILLQTGRSIVQQDSRAAALQAGDFAIVHLDREFQVCFDTPAALRVVRMPRSRLEHHGLPPDSIGTVKVASGCMAAQLLARSLDTIQAAPADMSEPSRHSLAEAVASLMACGLQDAPFTRAESDAMSGTAHRARIAAHVRENLRDPELSVGSIARAVGLSEDYIGKLFRGQTMSLSRWIWHLRLDACARDLRDPRLGARTVGEIGYAWGFNDASHFTRRFRDRYRMPPSEWRQCHVLATPPDEAPGHEVTIRPT